MNETNQPQCCCQNKWPLVLGMILLAAIIMAAILRDRLVNPPQWQVSVVGQGKVTYQADMATVNVGVQLDKISRAETALAELNTRVTKVVEAIKKAGIPAEDILTQNYSLNPQYDYIDNVSVLSGYGANQQLQIKVRDLKKDDNVISNVISEATKAGANQVNGVTFDVANMEDLKQEARLKAISDAKSKAGVLATAAGVKLKKVIGWWENIVQAPGSMVSYDGKGGVGGGSIGGGTIPSGNQEVIIEVSVNYQIK